MVWLHPVHWYGMTPLLKLWADEVLAFGWAYGPGGTALRGKDLWLVASTGGSAEAYRPDGLNRYFFDAFLPPYEQTAQLVGMRFLPPLVLHGAHRASDAEVDAHVQTFVSRLASYPDWPEIEDIAALRRARGAGDRPAGGGRLMDHGTAWLTTSLIYLAAAVIAVPLARALGLGSIIGYLAPASSSGPGAWRW